MSTSPAKTSPKPIAQTVWSVDFQKLFDALPNRYIAVLPDDPNFTIIAENKAHADMAHLKGRNVVGLPLLQAFPDITEKYAATGASELVDSFRRVIRTGQPDTLSMMRYDIKHEDGHYVTRYWRLTHYPLFDGDGAARKLIAIFQATNDITEMVKADARVTATERQLEQVVSAGLIGTWMWDPQLNMLVGDKYLAKIFGITPDEASKGITIDRFMQRVYPPDRKHALKDIQIAIEAKDIYESEYRALGIDGAVTWVISRGRIDRDAHGNTVSFPGVIVDITDRKQIESNLSFLAKSSAILAESLDYNTTLQTIAELTIPDIADWCMVDILDGTNTLEMVALAHRDPARIAWARKLRDKQGSPKLDDPAGLAGVIMSGKPKFYPLLTDEHLIASANSKSELKLMRDLAMTSVIMVPIILRGSAIGAISLITTDRRRTYTRSDLAMATELANRASLAIANAQLYDEVQHELQERNRLEDQLRVANEELEHRVDVRTNELEQSNLSLYRSNQELQDFAYVASHDLQEPLRKIQAFGNLLQSEFNDQLGPSGSDYLQRMRNAAARMSILIEDILSFSRVTTKGREFTSVNLRTVVQEVIDDLEVSIAESGATIRITDLPTIKADSIQMRQLFQNLIGNAIKFHRDDVPPRIKIKSVTEIRADKSRICRIDITDNGIGFDEKYLGRIFAVFQRLHNRESYDGTGIGLAVCRKIVERHGGIITARSKLGKGSTFIVTLPMRHKKGEHLL